MNMSQAEWESSTQRVGVVVGSIVKRDGKYLLVKENPDGKEVYNLPAGNVDKDEQIQSVKHVFSAEIIGGEEKAQQGEILEVVWYSYDEVAELEKAGRMRAPWVFDVINKFEHQV